MFAIIQETTDGDSGEHHTYRQWVARSGPSSTSSMAYHNGMPPVSYYADRANAERDAEWFRARNARAVEATKRRRKYKTWPATYTVIEVEKVSPGGCAVDKQAGYAA